jgi:aminoglycoside phosphotransferase
MAEKATDPVWTSLMAWCTSIVGPCEVMAGDDRFHGRTSVTQLRSPSGLSYLKVYGERAFWEREVHAYEQWAAVFGEHAPRLLGIRETQEPLALLTGELPGTLMDDVTLPPDQERQVWRAAGRGLAGLHGLAVGDCFGPCHRDGTCLGPIVDEAVAYVGDELERQSEAGRRAGYLDDADLRVIRAAQELVPAFEGEPPVPCHRDYGPANWLVTEAGAWSGVIDFEFAYWDVRVADFTRYPNWEWIHRPDLIAAFFEGYGRPLTPREETQALVTHTRYALGAILWGYDHAYHGYVAEAREALDHLWDRFQAR